MEAGIVTAVISAIVSLVVTLLTVLVSRSTIRADREKVERELQRSMTMKLYDARMECYPKAMEITEGLRNSKLRELGNSLSPDYFKGVLEQLDTWHATKAGFVLSHNAMDSLYALRDALREPPKANGAYTPEQVQKVWKAKGEFRASLRADIQLLFQEDTSTSTDTR